MEKVAVLRDGTGKYGEVDLAVGIDRDDADDGLSCCVSGKQHRARNDPFRCSGIGEGGPAETVVVFGVEIRDEIDVEHY